MSEQTFHFQTRRLKSQSSRKFFQSVFAKTTNKQYEEKSYV